LTLNKYPATNFVLSDHPRQRLKSSSLNSFPPELQADLTRCPKSRAQIMSEKDNIHTALRILSIQLTSLTFPDNLLPVDNFIARFEMILDTIRSLTHGLYPSHVKKTMLQAQLRGAAADWVWGSQASEIHEMGYEEFKGELRRQFP